MLKLKLFPIIFLGLLSISLVGCGSRAPTDRYYVHGTDSLENLKEIGKYSIGKANKGLNEIRKQAIQETALSIGARAGLAARAKVINAQSEKEKHHLDKAFDFNALLLEHNVLPPVLAEGRNTLNLADPYTIRLADRTYVILAQARFATTPPNWRQYLWMNFKAPKRPDGSLLPRNAEEKAIWDRYVTEGWKNGVDQANVIFADNLARLSQDYKGMILYRKLLAQKMVSPPYVARTRLGVTGDRNQLNIDDQILRITALPQLQTDSERWQPAVSVYDNPAYGGEIINKFGEQESIPLTAASGHWDPVIQQDRHK